MWKARRILSRRGTTCLFLYVAHDNLDCIVGYYFIEALLGLLELSIAI